MKGGTRMKTTREKEPREGFEGWMDERIHSAIAGLAHPFEKRIGKLQKRVEKLKERLQTLAVRTDSPCTRQGDALCKKKSGGETCK
jgi:hypothetical protein